MHGKQRKLIINKPQIVTILYNFIRSPYFHSREFLSKTMPLKYR